MRCGADAELRMVLVLISITHVTEAVVDANPITAGRAASWCNIRVTKVYLPQVS